jgi:glucan endo-1,3-alpha-glucosidase
MSVPAHCPEMSMTPSFVCHGSWRRPRSGFAWAWQAAVLAVTLLAAACASKTVAQPAAGPTEHPRLVFAHYMVCCPRAGLQPSVDEMLSEVRDAAEAGIDGFVLNCGGWADYPIYKVNSAKMFEAARRYGPSFRLFFSADQVPAEAAADMVISYASHPNHFRHLGRPVLSSFMGDAAWSDDVRAQIKDAIGENVFWAPFFYPPSKHEIPTPADVRWLVQENRNNEGFMYFGTAGDPGDLATAIRLNARAWAAERKLFMAGIGVYYRGLRHNYRIFESRGYESLARQWQAAIETPTQWVELNTWNDWGESSYIAPLGPGGESGRRWTDNWGYVLAREGFLEAHRYFMMWFKSGRQPAIETEQVLYAFRLHSRHVRGRPLPLEDKTAQPIGAWKLRDRVYFMSLLREPAELVVGIGSRKERVAVPAGVHLSSVKMRAGKVTIEVVREKTVIARKDGEFAIGDTETWANFNTLTGVLPIAARPPG